MRTFFHHLPKLGSVLFAGIVCCGALNACRQDMFNQPYFRPLTKNEFYSDDASARPLPPNTIPQENFIVDTALSTGKDPTGKWIQSIPVPITQELLARGQNRFQIYCSECHGYVGNGDGMIVQRGFPAPQTYHSDRLRTAPAGYFFDIITNGYGVMYPYASRVQNINDRWAIVAYIRALQLSQNANINEVPEAERVKLEQQP